MININDSHRNATIRYELALRGLTFKKISKDAGAPLTTAAKALYIPFPKAEKIVADALDTTPQALWPDRFDENGKRKRKKPGRKAGSKAAANAAKRALS